MKLALVSGDGLPVSGLLTVFRNVVDLGIERNLIELPIPADLGYSWRPDKPQFFPRGINTLHYPDWLAVTDSVPVHADSTQFSKELTAIRCDVARAATLSPDARRDLHQRVEVLAAAYDKHFSHWFAEYNVDWVCAINMTLSDAVPVTIGLHRAAARYWDNGRPGGILFWDHDLFASYSVYDRGIRMYPEHPNEFTPVPGTHPSHRWAVVSDGLAEEAISYPTPMRPLVVPNVLPRLPRKGLDKLHQEFLAQLNIDLKRPVLLAPVRVFRVKGIEIAVSLLAAVRDACRRRDEPVPYLLVFGSLDEDPDYAREVLTTAEREDVRGDVRFLNGVPLVSHRDATGRLHLDEVDLLRISDVSGGGVFFTPNRPDVESVGLGPALAGIARLPCALTSYDAFDEVYGADYGHIRVRPDDGLYQAGNEFLDWMVARRQGDRKIQTVLEVNQRLVLDYFPDSPWQRLLQEMATSADSKFPIADEKNQ